VDAHDDAVPSEPMIRLDGVGKRFPDGTVAVESLDLVPLLARALEQAHVDAPVTTGLARLIAGDLPLDDWIGLVRTTVPPSPARRRRRG